MKSQSLPLPSSAHLAPEDEATQSDLCPRGTPANTWRAWERGDLTGAAGPAQQAPLAATMKLSLHRSPIQSQKYYADVEFSENPATDLLG